MVLAAVAAVAVAAVGATALVAADCGCFARADVLPLTHGRGGAVR